MRNLFLTIAIFSGLQPLSSSAAPNCEALRTAIEKSNGDGSLMIAELGQAQDILVRMAKETAQEDSRWKEKKAQINARYGTVAKDRAQKEAELKKADEEHSFKMSFIDRNIKDAQSLINKRKPQIKNMDASLPASIKQWDAFCKDSGPSRTIFPFLGK